MKRSWKYARVFDKRFFADLGFQANQKLCLIFLYLQQGNEPTGPFTNFISVRKNNPNLIELNQPLRDLLHRMSIGRQILRLKKADTSTLQ